MTKILPDDPRLMVPPRRLRREIASVDLLTKLATGKPIETKREPESEPIDPPSPPPEPSPNRAERRAMRRRRGSR